jgi:hypothetical protein
MSQNWTPLVRPPSDGELVNQAVAGRAIQSLQQRTDFLYQRLNEFSAQNGKLVIQKARLEPSVVVGDWVYYDDNTDRYSKAIAEGEYDNQLKQYYASRRSYVVGICITASNGLGSILLGGWVEDLSKLGISPEQMLESTQTSSSFTPGRYYLSRIQPGKMTKIVGAPIIQVGFFNSKRAFIFPQQKDIFEAHVHHRFKLVAKPSSSQNTSGTGWMGIGGKQFVDNFRSKASPVTSPRNIQISLKGNGGTPLASYGDSFRVEVYRPTTSELGYKIISGSTLDIDDPDSGSIVALGTFSAWPNYGDWLEVPGTGFSISFFRIDRFPFSSTPYIGSLEQDIKNASEGIQLLQDSYNIFYPNDLAGWTNINPFSGEYTNGTTFRYLREFDERLNAVWPPTPPSSASVTNNGIILEIDEDFKCFPQDLLWIPNQYTSSKTYSPWPHNYVARNATTIDQDLDKRLELYFSKANIDTSRPLVLTLQSATPAIIVRDCLTDKPSTTGDLELDLRLDLNTVDGPDSNVCFSSIDAATQRFKKSSLVSRLRAGNGIRITQIDNPNALSPENGPLIISSTNIQSSGEVSIVSLKNAKESLHKGITPCVLFLSPTTTKCEIVSKIKIPQQELNGIIQLKINSSMFGSRASGAPSFALFKAVHYVLRNGVNINEFFETPTEGNFFARQYWRVTFSSYNSYNVFTNFFPDEQTKINDTSLILQNGTIGSQTSQALLPGDIILSVIERVSSVEGGFVDTYEGDVGITGINWEIDILS